MGEVNGLDISKRLMFIVGVVNTSQLSERRLWSESGELEFMIRGGKIEGLKIYQGFEKPRVGRVNQGLLESPRKMKMVELGMGRNVGGQEPKTSGG